MMCASSRIQASKAGRHVLIERAMRRGTAITQHVSWVRNSVASDIAECACDIGRATA